MQDLKLENCGCNLNITTNRKNSNIKNSIEILDYAGLSIIVLTDEQLIELRDFLNVAIKEIEND